MPVYGVTNQFASQSGNIPASEIDTNNTDLLLGINNVFLVGTLAGRPAPDGIGKGRFYYATDNQTLYRDNGSSWVQVAAATTIVNFPTIAAGGTADAITATYSPAIALVDQQLCAFVATAANATTTPTFAPNALTAHTITKQGGVALLAGDIPGNLASCLLQYNLANTRWELLNPASSAGLVASSTKYVFVEDFDKITNQFSGTAGVYQAGASGVLRFTYGVGNNPNHLGDGTTFPILASKNPIVAMSFSPNVLPNGNTHYGLSDGDGAAGNPTNGIFLRYINAGNIFCVARKAGVETATDSGVAPTLGAFQVWTITITSASVVFAVGGVTKVTTATNIPTVALYQSIQVDAANFGSTDFDYYFLNQTR